MLNISVKFKESKSYVAVYHKVYPGQRPENKYQVMDELGISLVHICPCAHIPEVPRSAWVNSIMPALVTNSA